jgi:hypothetical protein
MYSWSEIEGEIKIAAQNHEIDWLLIRSIVLKESSGNSFAYRFEPGWRWFLHPIKWARRLIMTEKSVRVLQASSIGLMQIMGTVAIEMGMKGHFLELTIPKVGLHFGCLKLKSCMNRYPKLEEAIASYNAGSARYKLNGKLKNQDYVDKVLYFYKRGIKDE